MQRGSDVPHVIANPQLVGEQREIAASIVENLDEDLLVEARWVLEIGIAAELQPIEPSEVIAIGDKAAGDAAAKVAFGFAPPAFLRPLLIAPGDAWLRCASRADTASAARCDRSQGSSRGPPGKPLERP
jgi:hypothetical protein